MSRTRDTEARDTIESPRSSEELDSFLREAAHISGRSKTPEARDRTGETLGHFAIDAVLGQGGMGVVYRAHDVRLGRPVALKILPVPELGDAERRRRILAEARSAARVTDPNIATIYDVGEAGNDVFIAMEYVDGSSLRELLRARGGKFPVEEALAIASQIARALGKAHAAGVVHRDVKPENVMVTSDGLAKLLDFGVAKLAHTSAPSESVDANAGQSDTVSRIAGTPGYMSPEQADGAPVAPSSDVYSFGVLLGEMLTGRRDKEVDTDTLDDELQKLLAKCLEPDSSRRFQNGTELANALGKLDSARPRAKKRSSAAIVLVALLVVAALGIIARLTLFAEHAPAPISSEIAARAPTPPAAAEPKALPEPPVSAAAPAPAPSAKRFARPAPRTEPSAAASVNRPALDPLAHQK